jgi:hypothetical protein
MKKKFNSNKKGQFTIIAALLVAVVLVSALITTYSAIRYDTVEDQPQLLSAIDEINLALNQVLGFTVGYYGSVLQITGNTTYANTLASNYLYSGLNNIADIKPEWAATFNVTQLNMQINWFSLSSYSSGNLSVTYDLQGVGIYGITYTTSSRLEVQITESPSEQAIISVFSNENEPINNLAKDDFQFYRYSTSNTTWEFVTPTAQPLAYGNGTYLVDFPLQIDADSYLVKIEDSRGINVVASSYNRYTANLIRNATYSNPDFVDNNESDVDSSSDIGTNTNFNTQTLAPDSIFDTLTEINTSGGLVNTTLIDGESFEGTWPPSGWTEPDRWNKESDQQYQGTYSADFDGGMGKSGYLTSYDMDTSSANAINVDFYYRDGGCESNEFRLQYYDGNNWDTIYDLGSTNQHNQWFHYQHRITEGQYLHSEFKIRFQANTNHNSDDAYVDLVTVKQETDSSSYQIDIEEQFTNVNYTDPNKDLCIKAGNLGSEPLLVDVWYENSWVNVASLTGLIGGWKNVSISSYLNSDTFTIRFRGSSDISDLVQDSWEIDSVLLGPQADFSFLLAQEDSTFVVEWLQNGTMRWLGQNLEILTETKPLPPIPVRSMRLNQTINGVNQQVPFQVEDWASDYSVPLGLSSNATVFGERQMIVFLLDNLVTDFTLWWDGSDEATQTSFAYNNIYFNDNPFSGTISNGEITLDFGSDSMVSTVVGTSTSSTATFMRINSENRANAASTTAYVIFNGVVRDIVRQESEWSGGAQNCPNVYANVVITLPAKVTYYTYKLRYMFIDSEQSRTITDFCPISLTTSINPVTAQTENGTTSGNPIVASGSDTFYKYSEDTWQHHWSQLFSGNRGFGIMFTDTANHRLYEFDSIPPGTPTGALDVDQSSSRIELLPITLREVGFNYAMDITFEGAVAIFDDTTPIYISNESPGLWVLVEYTPSLTVIAGN